MGHSRRKSHRACFVMASSLVAFCLSLLLAAFVYNNNVIENRLIPVFNRGNDNHELIRKRNIDTHKQQQKSTPFPTLPDTLEMARLSLLVYTFRHEQKDKSVCQHIRSGNFSVSSGPDGKNRTAGRELFPDLQCHWYYHDREHEGTQVMIVSSKEKDHLTVVFAGTDDIQTSLVDSDVRWEAFGAETRFQLPDKYSGIRVHAGFDHAVFQNKAMDQILHQIEHLRHEPELAKRRVLVTGHSLGAAAAILTSVALVEHYYKDDEQAEPSIETETGVLSHWRWPHWHRHHHKHSDKSNKSPPEQILCINFGCPRIGNLEYRDFFPHDKLQVWRIVLGWDLVPRLPDFFQHAGHTIQLSLESEEEKNENEDALNIELTATTTESAVEFWPTSQTNKTQIAKAYYEHYGNETMGYAGVPAGWASRPYFWVPGALKSHHILRYSSVLEEWKTSWVSDFVHADSGGNDDEASQDDDMWVDPPFDDFPGLAN